MATYSDDGGMKVLAGKAVMQTVFPVQLTDGFDWLTGRCVIGST